jgi:integrase-like protein
MSCALLSIRLHRSASIEASAAARFNARTLNRARTYAATACEFVTPGLSSLISSVIFTSSTVSRQFAIAPAVWPPAPATARLRGHRRPRHLPCQVVDSMIFGPYLEDGTSREVASGQRSITLNGRVLVGLESSRNRLACEAAGLKDLTPHALRHTFASRLAMAGVDPRTIQELGGWRSLAMVERYTHLSPTHTAAAVERIAIAGRRSAGVETILRVSAASRARSVRELSCRK